MRSCLISLLVAASAYGQVQLDARGVAMAGAYTVASRGYACVGFNPANLGFSDQVPFSWNLGGLNVSIYNNFISPADYTFFFTGTPETRLSSNPKPINLEDLVPGQQYTYKELLKQRIPSGGVKIGLLSYLPFPMLNISWGNYAFTSGLEIYEQTTLPNGIFKVLLFGNPINSNYDLSFKQDILLIGSFAFSFAMPFEGFNIGVTTKYLAGIGYAGVDSSGGSFRTEKVGLISDGFYRYTRAVGGNGVGLDIGITTREHNGWSYALAINNLVGRLVFGKRNYINRSIETLEKFYPVRQLLQIPQESGRFTARTMYYFNVDSATVERIFIGAGVDSLFRTAQEDLPASDSIIVVNYPAIFRVGAAYHGNPELTWYFDLSAGLDDYYFAARKWRLAVAVEITHFKHIPLRTGMVWGGAHGLEMGLGFGLKTQWTDLSFGLGTLGGYSINSAKGIRLAITVDFHYTPLM